MTPQPQAGGAEDGTRRLRGPWGERIVFLVLAAAIWPVLAVGVVGGYGFLVWMFQLLTGPPAPPGG